MTLSQFHQRELNRQQQHFNSKKNEFEESARKLAQTVKEGVGKGVDSSFYLDPQTDGIAFDMQLSPYEKQVFNQYELEGFLRENPSYYPTPANGEAIAQYLERNGAGRYGIVTRNTVQAAFFRLAKFNLLEHAPEQPTFVEPVLKPIAKAEEPRKTTVTGFDTRTGEPREFTRYEVERMSAEEYKRTFRLTRLKLSLPNLGPGSGSSR